MLQIRCSTLQSYGRTHWMCKACGCPIVFPFGCKLVTLSVIGQTQFLYDIGAGMLIHCCNVLDPEAGIGR